MPESQLDEFTNKINEIISDFLELYKLPEYIESEIKAQTEFFNMSSAKELNEGLNEITISMSARVDTVKPLNHPNPVEEYDVSHLIL